MFTNLSIRALLMWALGICFLLFLATGIAGYRMLETNRVAIQELLDNNVVRGDQAHRLASELLRARLAIVNAVARMKDGDIEDAKKIAQRAIPYNERADGYVKTLRAHPDTSAEGGPLYRDMISSYEAYRKEAYDPLVQAALAGNLQQTLTLNDQKVTPMGAAFTKSLLAYVDYASKVGAQISDDASATIARAVIALAVGGLVVLLLMAGMLYLFNSRVFKPLREAAQIFERIAAGDLTGRIVAASKNEIGVLFAAVKSMQDGLIRTVSTVRDGVEQIHTGSREIAAGNSDLSSRTEEQAASLEETAASMEELASTVHQNAENSRGANQLAQEASDVAQRGGDVVDEVVTTMQAISDSSRRIAEIVGVIDSIAFQTNILALNAAVEAARAGEQGKGFAVVASEVRALAQRSAQAAKEIKSLIDDSNGKVRQGAGQVESAGATMREIVSAVHRVSSIIAEISSASAEQSAGIQQVNQAVSQMDAVTQQNAALVEEASAAASSLEIQAEKLRGAVAIFKLASGQVIEVSAGQVGYGGRAGALEMAH
ncbi:methyl-accepting chemotaxis protein [Bordetella ansorpii]|uniref:Methyl-accepting chemotaxis protein n=1 Tax=Bordetella ansorpii TaxID=288768 RepID=A0A157QWH7_9BORD|nr:methyl-accepting chemotaxis protein [Bordetella ansorpii]SAI50080.1 methyl-accepting chemotaxis protein [Bordetella ansorpii]